MERFLEDWQAKNCQPLNRQGILPHPMAYRITAPLARIEHAQDEIRKDCVSIKTRRIQQLLSCPILVTKLDECERFIDHLSGFGSSLVSFLGSHPF